MNWKLVKDCLFHDNEKSKYIILRKDSIFPDVPYNNQTSQIKRCYSNCVKYHKSLNIKFIVLNCAGKQRVFEIGKSVIRSEPKRIRRIQRNESNSRRQRYNKNQSG